MPILPCRVATWSTRGWPTWLPGRTGAASLLVSLAAPRLRREGVPVTNTQAGPEMRLYRLLSSASGELGYERYNAHLRLIVSFADTCSVVRTDRASPEPRA